MVSETFAKSLLFQSTILLKDKEKMLVSRSIPKKFREKKVVAAAHRG